MKKGDEKLRFLMLHLPGMKDVAGNASENATKHWKAHVASILEGRNPATPNWVDSTC